MLTDQKKLVLMLAVIGTLMEQSVSKTRPGLLKNLHSQNLNFSEFGRKSRNMIQEGINASPDPNDLEENLSEEEEEWAASQNMVQSMSEQDPLVNRQKDFERWLKKRGNTVPEKNPEAARVASKQSELQELLQQLYEAQAAVKMETGEVTRTQQVAQESQSLLEEATNKVRMLSADLQAAQEAAASAAMRAHTAQLQLSAHDQLMFTARQRVDALSAQMVSVQAELAAAQQAFTLTNSSHLLEAQGRPIDPSLIPPIRHAPTRNIAYPPDTVSDHSNVASNSIEEESQDSLPISSYPISNRENYNFGMQ